MSPLIGVLDENYDNQPIKQYLNQVLNGRILVGDEMWVMERPCDVSQVFLVTYTMEPELPRGESFQDYCTLN